ncbi:MAG TPA: UvrD-helicase domain-containing protein [Actinomycetota bacterium]|nr:UvrD-helicase domain-containing protein [Actinomycetota bacterium]
MKTNTPQSVFDREAFASNSRKRLQAVSVSEQQLVFGRIDHEDEDKPLYVGRIGLSDDHLERILIDWRAPVGSSFYRATSSAPRGVVRRRTLITRGRRVVDINDDLLVPEKAGNLEVVAGEGALLHALMRERGEFMNDIVATIQAEQDEVIRSDPKASVILTGGPGTGKSVVALHRTAYLMYERAAELERLGVLLVGPGRRFSRYISRVLPSLGETAVNIRSVFDLTDPVVATGRESLDVARTKGNLAMAKVMKKFLIHTYPPPPTDLKATIGGSTYRLPAARVRAARDEVLGSLPSGFNMAADKVLRSLARAFLQKAGRRNAKQPEIANLARSLADDQEVVDALETLLPQRRAVQVWEELTQWHEDLRSMLRPHFPDDEADALVDELMAAGGPQVGDLPLIDELEWLLGPAPAPPVAEVHHDDMYDEVTTLQDRLDSGRQAAWAATKTTGFGHIVVDEAQDLSPMQWRMLERRGEDATWTIVGDPAQATLATPEEMEGSLARVLRGRRVHRFTLGINYRTPREIMEYASEASGISLGSLRSIRSGTAPVFFHYEQDPAGAIADGVCWLRKQGGAGCFVTLDPAPLEGMTEEFEVLSALDAKGLEFDHVVLFRPEAADRSSPVNASLILIGATRATKGLAVITAR